MYLSNTNQIRNADAVMIDQLGFPGVLLMESAGRQSAEKILELYPEVPHYLILAGPGNNGGDGWVIARYLIRAGKSVFVYASHDPAWYKGDAGINFIAVKDRVQWAWWETLPLEALLANTPAGSLVVDALLGTGVSGPLRAPFDVLINAFKETNYPVVAVDLPSGLDANTGALHTPPLPAQHTLTFQLPKICHYVTPAASYCGEVHVIDIGIWPEVLAGLGIQRRVITPELIPWSGNRAKEGHKGKYGHALLVGGSKNMAGAIALAGNAALHIGAGLSTCLIPASARCAFYQHTHGVMTANMGDDHTEFLSGEFVEAALAASQSKSVVAIGPGMGNTEETRAFLKGFLPQLSVPVVIDADGLNILAAHPELLAQLPPQSILTPHPGEMARLAGRKDVQEHRLEIAEAFAQEHQVILVLKGANTLVALPDGRTFVNPTGNPGMGTAGMGDVLTGTITGLIAQGETPEQAAILGVYLHGRAGDLLAAEVSEAGVTAEGMMPYLGKAIQELNTPNA